MHLRSSLRRALLLANQSNISCPAGAVGQRASLGYAAPSQKLKPAVDAGSFEKNIITSPYADCQFHDMTLTQKLFQSAMMWPDNIALVCIILNASEFRQF